MPSRRPLTTREHEVGALILIGIGAPPDSLHTTRTRVCEVDPAAPGSDGGGEVRACLDDPDWLELLGAGCDARFSVRRGLVRVHAWAGGDPAEADRVWRAIVGAMATLSPHI